VTGWPSKLGINQYGTKIVGQLVPLLENHTAGRDEAGYHAARAEMELRLIDFDRFLTAIDQEELQAHLPKAGKAFDTEW